MAGQGLALVVQRLLEPAGHAQRDPQLQQGERNLEPPDLTQGVRLNRCHGTVPNRENPLRDGPVDRRQVLAVYLTPSRIPQLRQARVTGSYRVGIGAGRLDLAVPTIAVQIFGQLGRKRKNREAEYQTADPDKRDQAWAGLLCAEARDDEAADQIEYGSSQIEPGELHYPLFEIPQQSQSDEPGFHRAG